MIPTADEIINASGFHPSRVHDIYVFGSRIYGTNNNKSDYDIIMVANNSVDSTELSGLKRGLYNIHVYTPKKFQEDLDWHRINNLECIFAPKWAKIKESTKWQFKLDLKKLRHSISHTSSNSYVKCKKKLMVEGEYYIGIKSLFHSIRIPMFGTQIATYKEIVDFSCANWIWDELIKDSKKFTWDELDERWRSVLNSTMSQFRTVASK